MLQKANEFRGHSGSVNSVAFNQLNDNMFVSASNDRSFRIWDVRKPKALVHTERTKEELIDAMFSPFGSNDNEIGQSSSLLATCNFIEEVNFYETRMWK